MLPAAPVVHETGIWRSVPLYWLTTSILVVMVSSACGGSPTSPGLTPLERTTLGMQCAEVVDGYQCQAYMNLSGQTSREVTGLATWSTSDAGIATVNSVGFVTAHRRGEVSVRAAYGGADGFMVLQVVPGGLRQYYRALSGWVRESAGEARIPGVTVSIVDGPNAGRSTVTGPDGAYQLYDLEIGTFRVRFSRPGYVTVERTFVLTGESFNSLDVFLIRSS